MNSFTFSKLRIFLIIVALFLIWQIARFLPWFQPPTAPDIEHGPASSGSIVPVVVTVFYEALCPDSKNFVVRQLLPTMNKASRLVNVSLVPYGKAKTEVNANGTISFSCQHGPTECLANKIHSCATYIISDPVLQVSYISCMISDNMIPELIGERCAHKLSVDWKSISKCSNSQKASLLLKEYGELTDSLHPKMTFVPTVLLDNQHKNQASVLKAFFHEVCSMFKEPPEECASSA